MYLRLDYRSYAQSKIIVIFFLFILIEYKNNSHVKDFLDKKSSMRYYYSFYKVAIS